MPALIEKEELSLCAPLFFGIFIVVGIVAIVSAGRIPSKTRRA